tara:strand:- start:2128 stop:2517 length:390 start_codon:yes stop_codon:yes gene_type:complete
VNSYRVGDIYDVNFDDENKSPIYPYIHIIPQPSTLSRNELLLSFSLLSMDLVDEDEKIETEVLSDTLQILQDIIGEFLVGEDYPQFEISLPLALTPFTERFSNSLSGWNAEIQISIIQPLDACITPIEN